MRRTFVAVLSALALVFGLAPAAHAQSGTGRIGNFDFTVTLAGGASDLRPGGHVRFNLLARNHQSGFPYTPSVLNAMGLFFPPEMSPRAGGGADLENFGDHGEGVNFFGGDNGCTLCTSRSVGRGSTRSGWLEFNIPGDALGGTNYSFDFHAHTQTGGSWRNPIPNIVSFTLPAVGTATSVSANPASLHGGAESELTATVSALHGSNTPGGTVEFLVDGAVIASAPVDDAGRAVTTYMAPMLPDRTPVEHTVTARYLGDGPRFTASTSGPTTVTVEPDPKAEVTSTVALSATPGLREGDRLPVALEADIDPSDGLDLPEGAQVEFLRDGEVIGTEDVDGVRASFGDVLDAVVDDSRTHTYTARLLPLETYDTIYHGAESEPETVTLAPELTPELSVSVDPDEVRVGLPVDLAATMTVGDAPVPEGSEVVFRANGRDIGTVPTDAEGEALLEGHVFDTAGEYEIVAVFDGAEVEGVTYRPATSAPATLTVSPLPNVATGTTIELQTEVVAGDEVEMTAVVTRVNGQALSGDDAGGLGSVWFFADGAAIGSAPVVIDPDTGTATATLVHRFAERGEYEVTAGYSGLRADDEVLDPSETLEPTIVTVLPHGVIIEEPDGPDGGDGGDLAIGSLPLGSVADMLTGDGGVDMGSLTESGSLDAVLAGS